MAVSMNDSGSRSGSSPEKLREPTADGENKDGKDPSGEDGEVRNGVENETELETSKDSESDRKSRERSKSRDKSSERSRSRSKDRKTDRKDKKKKHKKSYSTDKRSPVKKRHRSSNSERSRSRDKKKKRKYSRDSRSSSRKRQPRSDRPRHRRSSSHSSSPRRHRKHSRSRSKERTKRDKKRSTDTSSSRKPESRRRSRSSRSGSRPRRFSRHSRPSRSPRRDRFKSRDSRTSHVSNVSVPKVDVSKLIRLPGGATFKKELNEDEQIKKELENFQSKKNGVTLENGTHDDSSPTKKKHTIADFFEPTEAEEDFSAKMNRPTKIINRSFNFAPITGSSGTPTSGWKGGWVKEAMEQCNGTAPSLAPPRLTRAPQFKSEVAQDDENPSYESPPLPPAGNPPTATAMPTLTRRPDSSSNSTVPVKTEVNGVVKAEEVEIEPEVEKQELYNPANPILSDDDMEMDISDSDEYDEDEVNMSISGGNDPIDDDDNDIEEKLPLQQTPEPPPLRQRPPPPMRSRPSRFSSIPFSSNDASSPAPPPLERAPTAPSSTDSLDPAHAPPISPPSPVTPPPTPKYDRIKESIYLCNKDLVRAGKETRKMECDCDLPASKDEDACGDSCLNRNVMIECTSRCKCGDRCTNKYFQKKRYASLEVFWTNGKGHGLRATAPIRRGTFIIEYMGEVVSAKDFKKRSHEYARAGSEHHYFMELTKHATIDASQKGAISRFINHSCEPVAETQKWTVNGILRIGFFALRDIAIGEEVTFDYQFIHFGNKGQTCLCGAASCGGVIGRQAGIEEYRKKAGVKDVNVDYAKQILGMKRMDCQEDMQTLTLNMSQTSSTDIAARKKALNFVQEASKDLQRSFISFYGLDILTVYAKEDDLENSALKPQLLEFLASMPVATRDKVEDVGLLTIIEKWSKVNDDYGEMASELCQKWKKCMRRIPLKEKPKASEKEIGDETPPSNQLPQLTQMAPIRRRSPRLRPEREEIDPVVRAQLRQEHRRKFEQNLAQEEELRAQTKLNIDARLRRALEEDETGSDGERCSPPPSDVPSPDDIGGGPHTPRSTGLTSPSTWSPEKQKEIANALCEVYKPADGDEQLPIGFGTIISRFASLKKKEGKCLVLFTLEEIEHLKAFVELARIGLEMKDKKREERERRDRDRERKQVEDEKRKAAQLKAAAATESSAAALAAQTAAAAAAAAGNTGGSASLHQNGTKSSESVPDQMLPDNWATARDGEGNVYYYNIITRETSWDAPKMNHREEEEKTNKLRRLLERHIGDLLLSYRDTEAQRGRITNDDDYRYLIKRLSYGLVKRIVGELKTYRMNEKAKTMAAKYCHKYMIRQGEVYIRKKVSQLPLITS